MDCVGRCGKKWKVYQWGRQAIGDREGVDQLIRVDKGGQIYRR